MPAEALVENNAHSESTELEAVKEPAKVKGSQSKRKSKAAAAATAAVTNGVEVTPVTLDPEKEQRSWSYPGNEILQTLCEENGISEDVVLHNPLGVEKVEMFMYNLSRMECIKVFCNLKEVIICQQHIEKIEGLNNLTGLEKLWVVECQLTEVQGLEQCTNLVKLFLYSNKISRISNLGTLVNLETLWLNDNRLTELVGLENLVKTKELSAARNNITCICDSIENLTDLHTLNLADNQLGDLKDILNLARLLQLRKLTLADPDFGSNPVCGLCNYQTYMLFHLPQLSTLDTIGISDEAKQLAEATYMKKKMYYNMRIKTLKRNSNNVVRRARDAMQSALHVYHMKLHTALRLKAEMEREIGEAEHAQAAHAVSDEQARETAGTEEWVKACRAKLELVEAVIRAKYEQLSVHEQLFVSMKKTVLRISESNVSRYILELVTGGNVRLEDGKPSDVWYSSCVDLLQSRFFPADFGSDCGMKQLKVVRVSRIHNRFLRNRFEERLETLVDTSDTSYKRSLEYLFYAQPLELPEEAIRVAEYGFRAPNDYLAVGLDGGVSLTNSMAACDRVRLELLAKNRQAGAVPLDPIPTNVLVVTKVYLARSTVCTDAANEPIKPDRYSDADAVYRTRNGDARQKVWCVFDHYLVLPEYLVEYQYITNDSERYEPTDESTAELVQRGSLHAQSETEALDIAPLARTISKLVWRCQAAAEAEVLVNDVAELAKAAPIVPERKKMFQISDECLVPAAGRNGLPSVKYLNLLGMGISKLENLGTVNHLRTLILCFNEITKIEGLGQLQLLETLHLGFNLIKRIENLKGLNNLKCFTLNNNLVHRAEDLSVLRKYVPNLTELSLASNPICDVKYYRRLVLRRLKRLTKFDGQPVDETEREVALDNLSTVSVDMIRAASVFFRHSYVPSKRIGEDGEAEEVTETDTSWMKQVEELDISRRHLRRISNLNQLVHLRRLNVAENEIVRIEGIEQCARLEDLSLEDNRLARIENISSLCFLKKLDLGKNRITSLDGLQQLVHLMQLSLEDNDIDSLAGLGKLSSLMELYMGNNKIAMLREAQHLKELPKLIILDLSGNPLCAHAEYRLYLIFYLRRLKVLDGLGVELSEQQAAKDAYSGKLTEEFIVEKIGHRFFEHIRELDLSCLRVRDVTGCLNQDDFCNLRVLNLDNNMISDISVLPELPSLTVLRLNHNRLEALGSAGGSSGLDALTALEVLQLGYNELKEIMPGRLSNLVDLKVLFLQANDLTRIEGLERLTQLRELVLDKNRIKSIDACSFPHLINLRELRIEDNGLKTLANLSPLQRLQSIHMSSNRISDLAEMERLAYLPNLMEVNLVNNPVARKQLYRPTAIFHMQSLRLLDSKEVTSDERDRVASLFVMEQRNSAVGVGPPGSGFLNAQNQYHQQQPSQKVPIKMTAMTFDGAGSQVSSAIGSSLICVGSAPSAMPGQGESWNPYTHSTGDFFLPSGKLSSRRDGEMQRTSSDAMLTTPPDSANNKKAGTLSGMMEKLADKVNANAMMHRAPSDKLADKVTNSAMMHRAPSAERRDKKSSNSQPASKSANSGISKSASNQDVKKVARPISGERSNSYTGHTNPPTEASRMLRGMVYPQNMANGNQQSFTTPRVPAKKY